MTISSKLIVYSGAEAIASTYAEDVTSPADGNSPNVHRYSGKLYEAMDLSQTGGDSSTVWVAVAVRSGGPVFVDCPGSSVDMVVEVGKPVMFLASGGAVVMPNETGTLSDVSNAGADVEVIVYTDGTPLLSSANNIILDAAVGTTVLDDISGTIGTWRDVRPSSLAPLPFNWSDNTGAPTLIESDPDFGGKPSLDWSEADSVDWFIYNGGTATSIFDAFRIGSDATSSWTFMGIMKVNDNATTHLGEQIIWDMLGAGSVSMSGYSVDAAYRPAVVVNNAILERSEDELIEKPFVLVMRYDHTVQTVSIYRQGVWTDVLDVSGAAAVVATQTMRIGHSSPFDGKIAHMRWDAEKLSIDEINEYIQTAVSEYGIDDRWEQWFPLLSDADTVQYHRSNRGVALDSGASDPTTVDTWRDTREETDPDSRVIDSTEVRYLTEDTALGGRPALTANGINAYLENTAGDWSHLTGGSPTGFFVVFVYYREVINSYHPPILSMGAYNSSGPHATLDGVEIVLRSHSNPGVLEFSLNDVNAAEMIDEQSDAMVQYRQPYLVIFSARTGQETYSITEYSINDQEVVFETSGSYEHSPSDATASAGAIRLFAYLSGSSTFFDGGIGEFCTGNRYVTSSEIEELKAYAARVYGG